MIAQLLAPLRVANSPRSPSPALVVGSLCLAFGGAVGVLFGVAGGLVGTVLVIGVLAGYLMLRSVIVGLVALIGLACLLPFAALPVDIGFSPTFLDLVLAALFFVWVSRLVARKDPEFVVLPPTGAVLCFAVLAVASFVAGLGHSPLTATLIRRFAEILLSVLVFLLVINTVRTRLHLRLLVVCLIVAGTLAALIGIVLYVLPSPLTVRLLSMLRVVRYPAGSGVLRYIEENHELPLRATSTSIDPNVLGGMLIFTSTLTAAQVFAKRPMVSRRLTLPMLAVMVACLVLTFSRGSLAGLGVALVLMGLLRHRKMLWIGVAAIALMFALPPFQVYVQHLLEGLRGEDLATQMRLGEYKDALALIGRHPWLGVGFGGTPEIDTYLGVSSVYLLIAEEMGLLGLMAFLFAMLRFATKLLGALRWCEPDSELAPILLGTGMAVVGGLTGGILDHYLFNLSFPHAAALLWLVIGLGAVATNLVEQRPPAASGQRRGQRIPPSPTRAARRRA